MRRQMLWASGEMAAATRKRRWETSLALSMLSLVWKRAKHVQMRKLV